MILHSNLVTWSAGAVVYNTVIYTFLLTLASILTGGLVGMSTSLAFSIVFSSNMAACDRLCPNGWKIHKLDCLMPCLASQRSNPSRKVALKLLHYINKKVSRLFHLSSQENCPILLYFQLSSCTNFTNAFWKKISSFFSNRRDTISWNILYISMYLRMHMFLPSFHKDIGRRWHLLTRHQPWSWSLGVPSQQQSTRGVNTWEIHNCN